VSVTFTCWGGINKEKEILLVLWLWSEGSDYIGQPSSVESPPLPPPSLSLSPLPFSFILKWGLVVGPSLFNSFFDFSKQIWYTQLQSRVRKIKAKWDCFRIRSRGRFLNLGIISTLGDTPISMPTTVTFLFPSSSLVLSLSLSLLWSSSYFSCICFNTHIHNRISFVVFLFIFVLTNIIICFLIFPVWFVCMWTF